MKNKQHDLAALKYQLRAKAAKGQQSVKWTLNRMQLNFIESLGYDVQPYLYSVKPKLIGKKMREKYPFLKKIHYLSNGQNYIVMALSQEQVEILDTMGIRYYVRKYLIRIS